MYRRNFVKTGLAGLGTLALAKSGFTMKTASGDSDEKKWAVVYASQCGSTQQVAEWINEGMGNIADVIDVEDNPNVDAYDYFVIGGWIMGGNLVDPAKSFITNNKDALKPKITGLFTICGNSGNPVGDSQIQSLLTNQIVKISDVSDKPAKLFNGAHDPSCGMQGIPAYPMQENTQDNAIAFGEEIYEPFKVALKHANANNSSSQFGLTLRQGTAATPTAIAYNIPIAGHVKLAVCGLNGRILATLVSGYQKANSYTINWDGGKLAAGHYLVQLKVGNLTKTQKVAVYR